jgi:hypothetical protein
MIIINKPTAIQNATPFQVPTTKKQSEILSTLFMHFLIDHAPIGVAMLKNINNKET